MNLLFIRSVISKILKFFHYNVLDENNPVSNMIFFILNVTFNLKFQIHDSKVFKLFTETEK